MFQLRMKGGENGATAVSGKDWNSSRRVNCFLCQHLYALKSGIICHLFHPVMSGEKGCGWRKHHVRKSPEDSLPIHNPPNLHTRTLRTMAFQYIFYFQIILHYKFYIIYPPLCLLWPLSYITAVNSSAHRADDAL